jgi:hypothetical protein
MRKWLKKLQPERRRIEDEESGRLRDEIVDEEEDEDKTPTYPSRPPESSSIPSTTEPSELIEVKVEVSKRAAPTSKRSQTRWLSRPPPTPYSSRRLQTIVEEDENTTKTTPLIPPTPGPISRWPTGMDQIVIEGYEEMSSTPSTRSSTSSHMKLFQKDIEEEDMTPTLILPEVKSRRIGKIGADIKEPSTRLEFRERLRNLIRSSPKVKSRGIGIIAMDIEEPTPRPGFRERLRDLCHRRRSPEGPVIDQSYVSNPTLERDFLEEKYLRILYRFGYKFGEKIGDGKYGTVFECFFTEDSDVTDNRFGDWVVMSKKQLACKKVVIPEDSLQEKLDFVKNKLNPEKLALTLARHPNIIGLQNIWSNYESFDDEFPAFVLFFMERAEGDLWQYLEDREKDLGKPIDEQEVKLWFKMILSGLQYLHSISIAHLDLKPENILYVRDPLKPHFQYVAKITDFGMSYLAKKDRLVDLFHGTPEFVAPEIIECCVKRQIERYDPFRADIFSLGLVLRYMCAFNDYEIVPHPQMPQTDKYVYISLELLDLLMQLTRVSPNQRPTAEQITTFEWLRE